LLSNLGSCLKKIQTLFKEKQFLSIILAYSSGFFSLNRKDAIALAAEL